MKYSSSCVRSWSNSLLSHLGNQNKLPSVLLNHPAPKHHRQGCSWALSWVQCGFCLSAILFNCSNTNNHPALRWGRKHGLGKKLIFIKQSLACQLSVFCHAKLKWVQGRTALSRGCVSNSQPAAAVELWQCSSRVVSSPHRNSFCGRKI